MRASQLSSARSARVAGPTLAASAKAQRSARQANSKHLSYNRYTSVLDGRAAWRTRLWHRAATDNFARAGSTRLHANARALRVISDSATVQVISVSAAQMRWVHCSGTSTEPACGNKLVRLRRAYLSLRSHSHLRAAFRALST